MVNLEEVQNVWGAFIANIEDWQQLVRDIVPKPSGCGPIYEFTENPIAGRPNEDFCIADMRDLAITEPHYHPRDAYEVYFVIQGTGHLVVGDEVDRLVTAGDVVVMTPEHVHYTKPLGNLVIAVVNTPPFRPELYVPVGPAISDVAHYFDSTRYSELAT